MCKSTGLSDWVGRPFKSGRCGICAVADLQAPSSPSSPPGTSFPACWSAPLLSPQILSSSPQLYSAGGRHPCNCLFRVLAQHPCQPGLPRVGLRGVHVGMSHFLSLHCTLRPWGTLPPSLEFFLFPRPGPSRTLNCQGQNATFQWFHTPGGGFGIPSWGVRWGREAGREGGKEGKVHHRSIRPTVPTTLGPRSLGGGDKRGPKSFPQAGQEKVPQPLGARK